MLQEKDAGMESSGEQSGGEEAPMYSDSYLLPLLEELHKSKSIYVYNGNLLKLVEDLIQRATGSIEQGSKDALLDSGTRTHVLEISTFKIIHENEVVKTNVLQLTGSLSAQMTSEILNGNDTHSITLKVLNHLLEFSWEDKAAITIMAFAVTFGDLWLLVRIYADNALNEPMTSDHSEITSMNNEAYRNQIEANNVFIRNLANSLGYIFQIDLRLKSSEDIPSGQILIYVYWLVRCTIVAATQIMVLSTRGLDQYLVGIQTPAEVEKLKLVSEDLLRAIFKTKKRETARKTMNSKLYGYRDIIGVMRVIINDKDLPSLYHGGTKRTDHLHVLRGKRVLLLISGIDISSEDIESLKHVSIDSKKDEIVWIPVINRSIAEVD